ncbi:MAG: hypothetical protein ABI887_18380 [Burkholderiales bacterium]
MKSLIAAALLASAAIAHAQTAASAPAPSSPAKKELVAKALTLQQPIFESIAREVVMRPALQIGQAAGNAMQNVPPEKREALSKSIDADIRKYIDDAFALLRERAIKLAPSTVGPIIEEKMTEDELKQLVTWLDSSAAKKYQQIGGDLQQAMGQKLVAEAGPLLTPKVQALEAKVRASLGLPNPAAVGASAPPAKAAAPKKAASK